MIEKRGRMGYLCLVRTGVHSFQQVDRMLSTSSKLRAKASLGGPSSEWKDAIVAYLLAPLL